MTDMANTYYYNAWVEIVGNVKSRCICEFHVYKAWATNLPKIDGTKEEKAVAPQDVAEESRSAHIRGNILQVRRDIDRI